MIGRVNVAGRGEGPAPGPAYSIEKWCKVVGLTYSDISDISEQNMRILMSKHASVDYFMEWYNADNSMLDEFTLSEIAMKWIGLNDYICDKLLAISDAESRLLASEYWEYILKDHVPIMTSNTSPYGTASGSNIYESGYDFYKAFDGDDTTMWRGSYNTSYNASASGYLEFTFPNPICVKRVKYVVPILGSAKPQTTDILFVGYNGTEEIPLTIASVDGDEYVLNNYVYVTKLRVTVTQKNLDPYARVMPAIATLQFYGRSLNVSVPTMTSNTQPYGEVISNGTPYAPSSSEPQLPYEAFDNKTTTGTWLYTTDGTKPYVGYDFKKEINLKYVYILGNGGSSDSLPHTSRFETSLDGITWTPFGTDVVRNNTSNSTDIRTNAEGVKCRYVRNIVVDTPVVSGKTRTLAILKMNFYGVDYSDRTERTYLYDHGIKFVDFESYTITSPAPYSKFEEPNVTIKENEINLNYTSSSSDFEGAIYGTKSAIDVQGKAYLCGKFNEQGGATMDITLRSSKTTYLTTVASFNPHKKNRVDISNVSGNYYLSIELFSRNNIRTNINIEELWLE